MSAKSTPTLPKRIQENSKLNTVQVLVLTDLIIVSKLSPELYPSTCIYFIYKGYLPYLRNNFPIHESYLVCVCHCVYMYVTFQIHVRAHESTPIQYMRICILNELNHLF